MRLNLGCGKDIRAGYTNIDIFPASPEVVRGDFTDLTKLKIADESAEEIVAIDAIQYIRHEQVPDVLIQWGQKLAKGGTLHIESYYAKVVCNMVAYDQLDLGEFMNILYPKENPTPVGFYNLDGLEKFLNQVGFKTLTKGIRGQKFFITVTK